MWVVLIVWMWSFVRLAFSFVSTVSAAAAISTLSLHDALPICDPDPPDFAGVRDVRPTVSLLVDALDIDHPYFLEDRKSTRLNSSHLGTSYAVFCLKKTTLTATCHCTRFASDRGLYRGCNELCN